MIKQLIKIPIVFFLFISGSSLFAHGPAPYYNPYYNPAPYYQAIPQQICPYNQSSICYTYSGKTCSMFVSNYQSNWFSACLNQNFFHACLNVPVFPYAWTQNACYLRGMPCVCSFGTYSGYYIYEPGQVL